MASWLSPVNDAQTNLPPWGWNPAATFQASYLAAQENQRAQEKMAMEQELYRILLPQKAAEAEFNLKKLAYDSELLTDAFKTQTTELEERRRIIRSGGSGARSNVAGNGGSSNQAPAQDATSFNLTGTVYDRTQTAQSQPQTGSQPGAKKKVDLTGI